MKGTKFLASPCPACGTATLVSTTADAGGARDIDGNTVEVGDRIHVCDSCSALIPAGKPAPSKPKTPAKKKPAARKRTPAKARRKARGKAHDQERQVMPKPKGHKKSCSCPVCKRVRRKRRKR